MTANDWANAEKLLSRMIWKSLQDGDNIANMMLSRIHSHVENTAKKEALALLRDRTEVRYADDESVWLREGWRFYKPCNDGSLARLPRQATPEAYVLVETMSDEKTGIFMRFLKRFKR